jgi:dCMP deaminase
MNYASKFTAKEKRYHELYMDIAYRTAQMSFAERRKVGCVAVHRGNIIAFGFNGTPAGCDNRCEDEHGVTLPNVIHAEMNLLNKLKEEYSPQPDCYYDLYVTKEPCINCAHILAKEWYLGRVFYREKSSSNHGQGLFKLEQHGVEIYQM